MCLAIVKTASARLSYEDLAEAWRTNSDGAGLAWYDPRSRSVVIEKGFFSLRSLWAVIEENHDKLMLVHLRFATHGSVNTDNCHPFDLSDGALIHNGIIPIAETLAECKPRDWNDWRYDEDEDEGAQTTAEAKAAYAQWLYDRDLAPAVEEDEPSDTRLFVDEYLSDMQYRDLVKNRKMIERLISKGSKLATLHDNGRFLIFNEGLGHWRGGCWYSNHGYRRPVRPTVDRATAEAVAKLVPVEFPQMHGEVH